MANDGGGGSGVAAGTDAAREGPGSAPAGLLCLLLVVANDGGGTRVRIAAGNLFALRAEALDLAAALRSISLMKSSR